MPNSQFQPATVTRPARSPINQYTAFLIRLIGITIASGTIDAKKQLKN
jgi:hypothetical protein